MNNSQPWQKYPLIRKPLEEVNQLIQATIRTPYSDLQDALLEMASNGGKYLRPSLLILSAQIASKKETVSKQIIQLASSIEILHMASLIHDDIIDDSDERRGKISIQARFGKDTAVYAGDLLFTHFFDLILNAISEQDYMIKNAHTMHHLLAGELGQMAERFNLSQDFNDYLTNVKGKTAALFRLAAEEGSHFGNGDEQTTQALASGENLGIAFQIVDDILDYTGGKQLNKPTLEDLTTGVYSLPILLALSKKELREQLVPLLEKKRQMSKNDIEQIQKILLNSSVIEETHALAEQYTNRALANLAQLPQTNATVLLKKMTRKLVNRTL
ncbi:polyprenyl synthetase family protein [Lactobacillus crispatus]|uniref:polyprenyl synthetase family protein n=1 Tax=Lactobacillus crispatus TaxID=47770 RepID=UPI001F092A60|nr:polyprenyl synthetase family protein [Lactobacillus crispatus]